MKARARPLDLRDRAVTVMGLGLFGGGAAVARWLCARGARVTVTDLRSAADLVWSESALRRSGLASRSRRMPNSSSPTC